MTTTTKTRTSLENRIEAAAERLIRSPQLTSTEIELTPFLRLVRAADLPTDMQNTDPASLLPYIYRSEWFFLVTADDMPAAS